MKKITFVYLKNTKSISLSGRGCSFQCAHCNKHYLKQMDSLDTPTSENITSFLISGGLKKDGKSFILDNKEKLSKLKKKGSYKFNAHVGFVDDVEVDELAKVVDYVSFDFVCDSDVIGRVYKIKKNAQEYIDQYKLLASKMKVHPHITIGLDAGEIHWEYKAVDILHDLEADRLVFNVLIPTPMTEFAGVANPDLDEVRKLVKYARNKFKNKLLIIGCMRPGGSYRTQFDKMAIEEGVDRIVQPTPGARALAKDIGLDIYYLYECCVLD